MFDTHHLPQSFFAKSAVSGPKQLFAILGQSNAYGRGEVSAVTNTTGLAVPYLNIGVTRYLADNNTDPLPWTTFPRTPLKPRTFYAGGNTASGDMGCELTLGRRLDALYPNSVELAQVGVVGAPIGDGTASFGTSMLHPLTQFPTSPKPPDPPNMLTSFIQYVQAVELATNSTLAGIFWIQGETDATVTQWASAYQTNLTAVVTKLRTVWTNVPIVISRLSNNMTAASMTYLSTVQAQQDSFAAATTNVAIVNTDDLATQSDQVHYTADALSTLGTRLANALSGLTLRAPGTPTTTWTVDATSGRPRPQNAWEWQNLMLSAGLTNPGPSCAMMCQDLAAGTGATYGDGDLHDTIGGQIFRHADSTGTLGNSVTGWSAKAIGWNSPNNASRWDISASFGPDPTATSVFRVLVMRTTAAPSAQGGLFHITDNNNRWLMVWSQTTGKYRVYYPAGLSVDTVNSHVSSNFIIVGLQYSTTFSTCTLFTSLEKLTVPFAAVTRGATGIGIPSGYAAKPDPTFQCLMDITFTGKAAEMSSAQVKAFYQAMGETITWS